MNSVTRVFLGIAPHWRAGVAIAGTVGVVVMCRRCLETDKARAERAQRTKEKEIRVLADRIASYGRKIHHRDPTGDVVVGENDLAAQLRKRPDIIGTALNLLLGEQEGPEGPAQWILEAERVTTSKLVPTWDAARSVKAIRCSLPFCAFATSDECSSGNRVGFGSSSTRDNAENQTRDYRVRYACETSNNFW